MKRLALLVPLLLACGPFFYQAPPSLDHYPDRIPTKDWKEILADTQPATKDTRIKLISDLREFTGQIENFEKTERIKKNETFIQRNRNGEFAIPVANFLLELRELIELEIPDPDLKRYLNWRTEKFPPPFAPRVQLRHGNLTHELSDQGLTVHKDKLAKFVSVYDEQIESASPELKPFALTQRAGMYFRSGLMNLALTDFTKIVTDFPGHPRAEIARFMIARINLQLFRNLNPDDFPKLREFHTQRGSLSRKTEKSFEAYLTRHPQGRFTNDAYGWLGGLARDQGNIRRALNLQLRRLDIQATREVTAAVLRECDEIFKDYYQALSKQADGADINRPEFVGPFDYHTLAKHPLVAKLFVFHALDPSARHLFNANRQDFSGGRRLLDFLHRRVIVPGNFAAQSLAELGRQTVKIGKALDPGSYLVVAWASARTGDHKQALQLFDLGLKIAFTDELLHGKAVTLSRLGKNTEAALVYQNLLRDFPNSSLAKSSRFDLALALVKSGRPGQALLIFHGLHLEQNRLEAPGYTFNPTSEISQWVDTLVQFGSFPDLKETFNTLPENHRSSELLRRTVSMRALCLEDFETAQQQIIEAPPKKPKKRWSPHHFFDLTKTRASTDLHPLIIAYEKLAAPGLTPNEKAGLHLKIGKYWKASRGRLTLPLHVLTGGRHSEPDRRDQLLHDNARYLGLSDSEIELALLSRDELSHALHHFQKAAKIGRHPDTVAPALEEANEALFRMAELSPYRASIASRNQHSELSADFVKRIRKEFPNRPEAARIHPFTFRPPALLNDWMPGDRAGYIADRLLADLFDRKETSTEDSAARILAELFRLPGSLPAIRDQLAVLSKEFRSIRSGLSPRTINNLGGHLNDLQAVANHSGMTGELFHQYLPNRLSKLQLNPQANQPLSPFLEFLSLTRNAPQPVDWSEYLEAFPNGPKSESASLRLVRREIRKVLPIPHIQAIFFPFAPRTTGYKGFPPPIPAKNPQPARDLLAQHRKTYLNGKYQADLDLLEAASLIEEKEYSRALKFLTNILTNPSHPELYQDASLYFAELSHRLLYLEERAAVLAAFREISEANVILNKMAQGGTCISRLRPFLPLSP